MSDIKCQVCGKSRACPCVALCAWHKACKLTKECACDAEIRRLKRAKKHPTVTGIATPLERKLEIRDIQLSDMKRRMERQHVATVTFSRAQEALVHEQSLQMAMNERKYREEISSYQKQIEALQHRFLSNSEKEQFTAQIDAFEKKLLALEKPEEKAGESRIDRLAKPRKDLSAEKAEKAKVKRVVRKPIKKKKGRKAQVGMV